MSEKQIAVELQALNKNLKAIAELQLARECRESGDESLKKSIPALIRSAKALLGIVT